MTTQTEKPKTKPLLVDENIHTELKIFALRNKISLTELVNNISNDFLNNEHKNSSADLNHLGCN